MNSITIGRKKQAPEKIDVSNKKTHSQNRATRKIPLSKQQKTKSKAAPHVPRTVQLDTLPPENHPYVPFPTITRDRTQTFSSANDISIYNDNQFCSSRAAIATFIIIIIIVIAAGVSVGIVFAAIKTPNSSGTGNNQNTFSTISTGILTTSSISIGNQIGLPCSGYTEIDDPTRNVNYTASSNFCDNGQIFNISNGGSWIRFVGTGGTIIPLSSPGINHCGAFLSSWYNSTLPTTPNLITNGVACFDTYAQPCGFAVDISIVYCSGGYYVYFLPPLFVCSARYCTE